MKKVILAIAVCCGLAACEAPLNNEERVALAKKMLTELEQKSAYSDSLKAAVLLQDPEAQKYLVRIPGEGFGFAKEYKEKVRQNRALYNLVDKCNVSVLAYGTLKNYVTKELIEKTLPPQRDSLRLAFARLR